MLKKAILIFLLSMYVISITELSQLFKIPVLIEHFSEHQSKNKNISFFGFLYSHYSQADDNDGDEDKERNMPFKSHDTCISLLSPNFIVNSFHVTVSKPVFNYKKTYASYTEQFLTSAHLNSIWQPPKFS